MSDMSEVYAALRKADAAGDVASAKKLSDYIRTQTADTPKPDASLSDQIPGERRKINPEKPTDVLDKARGAVETAGSVVAGMPAAGLGYVGGALGGIAGSVASGEFGTPEGSRKASESADEGSAKLAKLFQPKSQSGQAQLDKFGRMVESTMIPPWPVTGGIPGIGAAAEGAESLVRKVGGYKAIIPRDLPSQLTVAQTKALDTLERFSKNPSAIARAKTNEISPGSRPTLAETTEDPGLAQLQRSQQSKSVDLASELSERKKDRLGARETAMEQIAGSEGEMEYYKEARKAIAEPLYKKARETPIDPKLVTPELRKDIEEFMQRPTVQEARAEALKKARDSGEVLSEQDLGSVKGLHWMKRSIDDKISAAKRAGNDDQARIYLGIQEKLIGTMQKLSPDYAKAMAEYEAASKPINRLEVGQYLKEKLFPPGNQYGGTGITVNQFAKALEHPDQTAKLATGFSGAKLENILTEGEINSLKNIARDVVREKNVESAARISGSPTAQLSAAQQRLVGFLDKLEAVPLKVVKYPAKAASWAMEKYQKSGNEAYEAELNKMLLNPAYARSIAALRDSSMLGAGRGNQFGNMINSTGVRP